MTEVTGIFKGTTVQLPEPVAATNGVEVDVIFHEPDEKGQSFVRHETGVYADGKGFEAWRRPLLSLTGRAASAIQIKASRHPSSKQARQETSPPI